MKCVRCQKREAVNPCRCLVIERSIKDSMGKRNIYEQLAGTREAGLCRWCTLKTAMANPPTIIGNIALGAMIAGGAALVLSVGGGEKILNYTLPVVGVCAAVFVLCWCIIGPVWAMIRPRDVIGSVYPDGENPKLPGDAEVFIPVGDNLYKNQKAFEKELLNCTPEFKEKLYRELIQTGMWKVTPEAPEKPSWERMNAPKPAPEKNVQIPDSSDPDFMSACVERLLQLYRRKPDGFLKAEAGEVRSVGKKLDAAGGMDMMLEAHGRFAAQNPRMARNLEMVWDGIGGWAG